MTSPLSKEQSEGALEVLLAHSKSSTACPCPVCDALRAIATGQHAVYDTATHAAVPWEVIDFVRAMLFQENMRLVASKLPTKPKESSHAT